MKNFSVFSTVLPVVLLALFWLVPTSILCAQEIDVIWTDTVGVSVNGNTITKTAAAGGSYARSLT
jgi:hypothetical protein